MKAPEPQNQTIACPRCYTSMLDSYAERGGSGLGARVHQPCARARDRHSRKRIMRGVNENLRTSFLCAGLIVLMDCTAHFGNHFFWDVG